MIKGINEKLQARAFVKPETANKDSMTVEVVATTERAVRTFDWEIGEFNEILSMKDEHVDLERFKSGAPLVDNHNWRNVSIADQLGVIEDSWVEGDKLISRIKFSKRHKDIFEDVVDGIITNFSIGYTVKNYENISEDDDKIPTLRAVSWTPHELSAVLVPADPTAKARSLENEIEKETPQKAIPAAEEIDKPKGNIMNEKEMQEKLAAERKAAKIAEQNRQKTIRSDVKFYKLDESFADELIEKDLSVEDARKSIMEKRAALDEAIETDSKSKAIEVGKSTQEKKITAMTDAILHKAMPAEFPKTEGARDFSHLPALHMLEELNGERSRNPLQTIERAFASSDFEKLTSNVMNKSIQKIYGSEQRNFLPLVNEVDRTNYKENTMLDVAGFSLEKMDENGNFTQGFMTETGEKYQVEDYGRMIDITHKTILNDDLGLILVRAPQEFADSAISKEKDVVWAIFGGSYKMADGNELFLSSRGNLAASGAAPSTTTLNAALKALAEQKHAKKKKGDADRFKNFMGKYLVGGYAQKVALKQLVANITPASSGDVNPHLDDNLVAIIEPRIADNRWCVAAQKKVIEFAHLLGQRGPSVTAIDKHNTLAKSFRVHHAFGVGVADATGLYKNPGQ